MQLRDFQRRFAAALTSTDARAADFFSGDDAQKRAALAIYRNNVAHSLREAMAEGFPTVKQLLGEEFFNGLAVRFLRENLPQRRVLADYGHGFAEFLGSLDELGDFPWLADVARIEMARREVFHAADDDPLRPEDLQNFSDEDLTANKFSLRASLVILSLDWPADTIWQAHQNQSIDEGLEIMPEEIYLAVRRDGDEVIIERISAAWRAFLARLEQGENLGQTVHAILANHENFDLASALSACLSKKYFKRGAS